MPKIVKKTTKKPQTKLGKKLGKSPVWEQTHRNSGKSLWDGPTNNSMQGGVSQSLMSRYLTCKERFRLLVIEGLRPVGAFNARTEYGSMWHECEEGFAKHGDTQHWKDKLKSYGQSCCEQFPTQGDLINHWYTICKMQFPIYIDWWKNHPDVKARIPLLQEEVFHVPYKLPTGRTVWLRGKWDSVDQIRKGRTAGIFLQENKTKGEIKPQQIRRQLQFDLQSMIYLVALQLKIDLGDDGRLPSKVPVKGVRYNVIRRPLGGGKGSIRQKKPTKANPNGESRQHFLDRLRDDYILAEPETYFMRWTCEVSTDDLSEFKRQFLTPELENLCDSYEWWDECKRSGEDPFDGVSRAKKFPHHLLRHARLPFGVYNVLAEGGNTDLDEYLQTGSEVGLMRAKKLFRELE